jgi:hypothetical protein
LAEELKAWCQIFLIAFFLLLRHLYKGEVKITLVGTAQVFERDPELLLSPTLLYAKGYHVMIAFCKFKLSKALKARVF